MFIRLLFLMLFVATSSVSAGEIIKKINILGNKRIDTSTILDYLGIEEGSNSDGINDAIKALYRSNLFNNIKSEIHNTDDGIVLDVHVSENPVVSKIIFNGLKKIKPEDIKKEMSTKEKLSYSRIKIRNDVKRIEAVYQKLGYLDVKVAPMVEVVDDMRVNIIIVVVEGRKSTIERIDITGNKKFSKSDIKENALTIRENSFLRFGSSKDYDLEKIYNERQNLMKFYKTKGFAKFDIQNILVDFNQKTNNFSVNFVISEGDRYKFGTSDIKSFLENFDEKEIKPSNIKTKSGTYFNVERIDDTKNSILEMLRGHGFLSSEIEVNFDFNEESKIVDVHYVIKNAPRIYINRINIAGNIKTSDKVIRREILFAEGDVYSIEKMKRSIERIRHLGYFSSVDVKEAQLSNNKIDINLVVTEQSTSNVNFAVGFDQLNGLSGSSGITESNLFGEGYNSSIYFEKTQYSNSERISFTNPYFHDRNILLGANIGKTYFGNPNYMPYAIDSTNFSVTAAYEVAEHLRHSVTYSYKLDNTTLSQGSGTTGVSFFILGQLGQYETSVVTNVLAHDRRDNQTLPTSGYSIRFSNGFAGLGGNINYISNELKLDKYIQLFDVDDLVFATKFTASKITGCGGSNVNVKDLYVLGATYGMRGFNYRGVGPRFAELDANGNPIAYDTIAYGGDTLAYSSFELRFPNFLPKDLGFSTFAFVDAGTLFNGKSTSNFTDTKGNIWQLQNSQALRVSAGVGVNWKSPMGLIGLVIADPIQMQEYDTTRQFLITFGNSMM